MNTAASSSNNNASSNDVSTIASSINCVHYERKCVVVSPCCDKMHGYRVRHYESVSNYNNSIEIEKCMQ